LPSERYRHAVEPACGVGVLTAQLAMRADKVHAFDAVKKAVAATDKLGRGERVYGANLGVRGDVYLAVGGFGPLSTSEDQHREVREATCAGLGVLGIRGGLSGNRADDGSVSAAAVPVFVVRPREDIALCRETLRAVNN
jgi:acetate kinase